MASLPVDLPAAAARTVLLAQDDAVNTLADAERLAAGVLAEAERQASLLLSQALQAAESKRDTRGAIDELSRARHEELLAILTDCREEMRAILTAPTGPIEPFTPEDDKTHPRDVASRQVSVADEEYLAALYSTIAGPQPTSKMVPANARQRQSSGRHVGPLSVLSAVHGLPMERDDVVIALPRRRPTLSRPPADTDELGQAQSYPGA